MIALKTFDVLINFYLKLVKIVLIDLTILGKTTIFISFPLNFHFFADSVQLSLFISLAVIFSTTFII